MVLESAKLAEVGTDHDTKILTLAKELDTQEGELARAGSFLLKGFAWPIGTKKPEVNYETIEPLKLSPEALNVFTVGSCVMDGGERWHAWYAGMRKALASLQRSEEKICESGSWDGENFRDRAQATAIRCLTLEHYRCFNCRNVFREKE
jgi:hypothetical protein